MNIQNFDSLPDILTPSDVHEAFSRFDVQFTSILTEFESSWSHLILDINGIQTISKVNLLAELERCAGDGSGDFFSEAFKCEPPIAVPVAP